MLGKFVSMSNSNLNLDLNFKLFSDMTRSINNYIRYNETKLSSNSNSCRNVIRKLLSRQNFNMKLNITHHDSVSKSTKFNLNRCDRLGVVTFIRNSPKMKRTCFCPIYYCSNALVCNHSYCERRQCHVITLHKCMQKGNHS